MQQPPVSACKVIAPASLTVTLYPPLVQDPRNISLIISASFQSVGEAHLAKNKEEDVVTSLAQGSVTVTARDTEITLFPS